MIALRRRVGVILVTILVISLTGIGVFAQGQPEFKYFPESGHNVRGDFLTFYNSAPNPTLVYGYPITEEFTDESGLLVQYFQRARFEYHPEKPFGQRVQLTPVGSLTYNPAGQLVINNPLACRSFVETGYAVCFAFLEFFEENGSVGQFGYPISPFEFHGNLIVQSFQKARLEWRPWQGEGQRVGVADLGRAYFDQLRHDPVLLRVAEPLDRGIKKVLELQVHAFVLKARTATTDMQTVYILVQDQNLQPVNKATCEVTVRLPSGMSERRVFISQNGICTLSFQYMNQPNGRLVYIDVKVSYDGISAKTMTSFRIWE